MKAYFLAIVHKNTAELLSLLTADSSTINSLYSDKPTQPPRTLLRFVACLKGMDDPVKVDMMAILFRYGAALDVIDADGRTALSYATEGNSEPAVRFLLENGADPLIKDRAKKIAYHYVTPASGCSDLLFNALRQIATTDTDSARRRAASKYINSTFKATGEVVSALSTEHEGSDLEILKALIHATGMVKDGVMAGATPESLDASRAIGESLLAAVKPGLKEFSDRMCRTQAYCDTLTIYMQQLFATRPVASFLSAPHLKDSKLLEQQAQRLFDSLDVRGRMKTIHDHNVNKTSTLLLEVAILADFIMNLKASGDKMRAFEEVQSKYKDDFARLPEDSKVFAFFEEHCLMVRAASGAGCSSGLAP